ncbi:MAG: type III secretion HpaP family protein [Thermodesulforhabdaceae bacterium]
MRILPLEPDKNLKEGGITLPKEGQREDLEKTSKDFSSLLEGTSFSEESPEGDPLEPGASEFSSTGEIPLKEMKGEEKKAPEGLLRNFLPFSPEGENEQRIGSERQNVSMTEASGEDNPPGGKGATLVESLGKGFLGENSVPVESTKKDIPSFQQEQVFNGVELNQENAFMMGVSGKGNPREGKDTIISGMLDKNFSGETSSPVDTTGGKLSLSRQEQEPDDVVAEAVLQMNRFSTMVFSEVSPSVQKSQGVGSLPEPVRKMVERILVEVPDSSNKQEVRISLSNDVLPDTEVRLVREDGVLKVKFVTGSEDAHRLLSPNLSSLKDQLESRQGDTVMVSVEMRKEGEREQNEGRSRQQRSVWEEYEG